MSTPDQVRHLLGQPEMTDDEALAIDDACRHWAELVLEAYETQDAAPFVDCGDSDRRLTA